MGAATDEQPRCVLCANSRGPNKFKRSKKMKYHQIGIVVTVGALCACTLRAEAISIKWTSKNEVVPIGDGPYLPRVASDWVYGSLVMYQAGTGFATIAYQTGNTTPTPDPTSINWCCYPGTSMNNGVGSNTSGGLANADNYDIAVEVHQGGQENGAELWSSLGSGKLDGYKTQQIPVTINWAAAKSYGTGYNPTVGVNNSNWLYNPVDTSAVEVH